MKILCGFRAGNIEGRTGSLWQDLLSSMCGLAWCQIHQRTGVVVNLLLISQAFSGCQAPVCMYVQEEFYGVVQGDGSAVEVQL